jgi:hypothetical protein
MLQAAGIARERLDDRERGRREAMAYRSRVSGSSSAGPRPAAQELDRPRTLNGREIDRCNIVRLELVVVRNRKLCSNKHIAGHSLGRRRLREVCAPA